MLSIIDHEVLKFTGKSGYSTVVNSISFKSVDTATYLEDRDSMNYPIYEPYLTPTSYSYENWTKFRFNIKPEFIDNVTSQGLLISECVDGEMVNKLYTKITNICIWFSCVPLDSVQITFGATMNYVRPVDSPSLYALEDVKLYHNEIIPFENTIKYPLYFNGASELDIVNINNTICDYYIVWQLQVMLGEIYQIEPSRLKIHIHYELL